MHHQSTNHLSKLNSDDTTNACEPMSHIYLKHGLTAKVPASCAEAFLVAKCRYFGTQAYQTQRAKTDTRLIDLFFVADIV